MFTFGSDQVDRVFETKVVKLGFIGRVGKLVAAELASHDTVLNRNRRILDAKAASFRVNDRWPEVRRRVVVLHSIYANAVSEFTHHDTRVALA